VPRRAASPGRSLATGRLSGDHALAHRGHPSLSRGARASNDEAVRHPHQRGSRRDRRGGGALSSAGRADDRRRCPCRLVPVSDQRWRHAPVALRVPRVAQPAHDAACVGVDRGDAGGAGEAHRGEHPPGRAGRAPAESDSLTRPLFYGWVIVAVSFVTMGVGVNARTAFSLLFPPILDEFGWERGVTAGAFSFGFLVTAAVSPFLGRLMDHRGPRLVIELGVGLMAAGLMLATLVQAPWHLYATLGVLVGGGGVCLGYTGQALFLPNWFVRRRGLAMSLAFSGVGV